MGIAPGYLTFPRKFAPLAVYVDKPSGMLANFTSIFFAPVEVVNLFSHVNTVGNARSAFFACVINVVQ